MSGLRRALTERQASTDPGSDDPRLMGRTYAIPFDDVWMASVALAQEMRGWTMMLANDEMGRIGALSRSFPMKKETEVIIDIGLDENAQTRVDMAATSRGERGDFGRCRRLIGRFTARLDRKLGAQPGQILDPSRLPTFVERA